MSEPTNTSVDGGGIVDTTEEVTIEEYEDMSQYANAETEAEYAESQGEVSDSSDSATGLAAIGEGLSGNLIGGVDYLAMTGAEYLIIQAITKTNKNGETKKHPIVSIGLTLGLQFCNILPSSISPILNLVSRYTSDDSSIGQLINTLQDKINDGQSEGLFGNVFKNIVQNSDPYAEDEEDVENEEESEEVVEVVESETVEENKQNSSNLSVENDVNATEMDISDRIELSMSDMYDMTESGDIDNNFVETMRANGEAMVSQSGENNTDEMLMAANMDKNDEEFYSVSAMSSIAMFGINDQIENMKNKNGELSDKDKETIKEEYKAIFDGFEAYAQGAQDKASEVYADSEDSAKICRQVNVGISNTMQAVLYPVMDSLINNNIEYGLFTQEELEETFDKYADTIPGCVKISTYNVGDADIQATDAQKAEAKELMEQYLKDGDIVFEYGDNPEDYLNVGLDDELVEESEEQAITVGETTTDKDSDTSKTDEQEEKARIALGDVDGHSTEQDDEVEVEASVA